jgi:hypothetical protein
MRIELRLWIGMLALALFALPGLAPAVAQDATPAATPVVAVCAVEPRSETFIADLLAAPEPEIVPTAVIDVPRGEAVDDQTRAEVVAVIEQLIACVNEGDFLRSFALFEDEYLRRVIDPDGLMAEDVAIELGKSFATPTAADESNATTLVEIVSVERLEGGAVAVVFRTKIGEGDDSGSDALDLFVLREIEGRWLIVDGLTSISDE